MFYPGTLILARTVLGLALTILIGSGFQTYGRDTPAAADKTTSVPTTGSLPVTTAYDIERYRPIWDRSPFTLSSASVEPTAGFASNLTLVAIGKIDQTHYVRVLDKISKQRTSLTPEVNASGIKLVSVQTNDDPLKASARIAKGGEEAVIRYDATLLKAAPVAAAPVPRPANGRRPYTKSANPNSKSPRTNTVKRRRRLIVPNRPPAKR